MMIIRHAVNARLFAWAVMILPASVFPAAALADSPNPCGTLSPSIDAFPEAQALLAENAADASVLPRSQGLIPVDGGLIVYDANQGVCWLADADLASNPVIREQLAVPDVNADGTMDYATALKWVDALNKYDNGRGFLGHANWQLPDTPLDDFSCSSHNHGSFGASCTGSALGNLYAMGLGITFPDSVVPHFTNRVGPFRDMQPAYYWTQDSNGGGEVTMSFINGVQAANTTQYNYMHVMPMTRVPLGERPVGSGVLPYTAGEAAGKAVYDTHTGISWVLDANLAARQNFGLGGSTTITSDVNGTFVDVPLVDVDGAMLFATASDPVNGWLAAMNNANYAGTSMWTLPHLVDLQTLFHDLGLQPNADPRLVAKGRVGPFWNFQPFFYWACERDQSGDSQSPCNPDLSPYGPPGTSFAYSFNFDDGFEGTSLVDKQFYVIVYYPAH